MEQIDWIKQLEAEEEDKKELIDWIEKVKHDPEVLLNSLKRWGYFDSNKTSNWMDSVFKSMIKKQKG